MIVDDIMRMITMMKTSPQTNLLDLIASTNRNAIGSELEETMQSRVNPDLKPTVDNIGFRGELEKLKNVIQPTEMLDILEGAYDGFLDVLFDFEFPQRQQNQLLDETKIEITMRPNRAAGFRLSPTAFRRNSCLNSVYTFVLRR